MCVSTKASRSGIGWHSIIRFLIKVCRGWKANEYLDKNILLLTVLEMSAYVSIPVDRRLEDELHVL